MGAGDYLGSKDLAYIGHLRAGRDKLQRGAEQLMMRRHHEGSPLRVAIRATTVASVSGPDDHSGKAR
jgi:hypothetical protein